MADVQFQSENVTNTQEITTTDQHPAASEKIDISTESSNQEDIFDDHQINTPFGWNEHKSPEAVSFGGKHAKSTSVLMTDDIKKTEEDTTLQGADTAHDSIHDVIPDMDTAGLWISAALIQQTSNETNNTSQAYNKIQKTPPSGDIPVSHKKTNSRRLHGITLCISLSIVGLFIYLNPDNTYIRSSENISHHIKKTYSETLIHAEKKSNEIYEKIISKLKQRKTKTPNTQETQTDTTTQTNVTNRN